MLKVLVNIRNPTGLIKIFITMSFILKKKQQNINIYNIKHERRNLMKKTNLLIFSIAITIIGISSIVSIGNNVSAVTTGNQGNGDCWGVDIFTDAATENTTTSRSPITKVSPTTKSKKITVGKTTIKKVTIKKNVAKIRLKKVKGATGYVVKLSNSNKFKKVITKKVKKTNCVIKSIKVRKKYYIKARAYKKVDGKTYYGEWGEVKHKNYKNKK